MNTLCKNHKHGCNGVTDGSSDESLIFCDECSERNWANIQTEVEALLKALKKDIADSYRATNDPDDKTPGMQVTVSTKDGGQWSYQTGDNSYSGACYFHPHWAVIYLCRRSNCAKLASEAVEELAGLVHEAESYAAQNLKPEN